MNSNDSSRKVALPIILIAFYLVLFLPYINGTSASMAVGTTGPVTTEYQSTLGEDGVYTYTSDVISAVNSNILNDSFCITKVVNSNGYSKYEIPLKTVDGYCVVWKVSEDDVIFCPGNFETATAEFTLRSRDYMDRIKLYIPSDYIVRTFTYNDSIEYNIEIPIKEVTEQ